MNQVSIIGNISTDVEVNTTPNGKFVAKFNVAVNNPFNREKTSFLPVEVWGKIAELTGNFCVKGSKVGVTGYLEVDQWEKDGRKQYKTKIVGNTVEFLTPKGNNTPAPNNSNRGDSSVPQDDPFKNDRQIDIDDSELPF